VVPRGIQDLRKLVESEDFPPTASRTGTISELISSRQFVKGAYDWVLRPFGRENLKAIADTGNGMVVILQRVYALAVELVGMYLDQMAACQVTYQSTPTRKSCRASKAGRIDPPMLAFARL